MIDSRPRSAQRRAISGVLLAFGLIVSGLSPAYATDDLQRQDPGGNRVDGMVDNNVNEGGVEDGNGDVGGDGSDGSGSSTESPGGSGDGDDETGGSSAGDDTSGDGTAQNGETQNGGTQDNGTAQNDAPADDEPPADEHQTDDERSEIPQPGEAARLEVGAAAAARPPSGRHRYAGDDRFATAAAISRGAYPKGSRTVVVATGMDFPDALAAGPLAAKLKAPLLLTQRTQLPASTKKEIRRLKPSRIIVIGGTGAVNGSVAKQLRALAKEGVIRLQGKDRYETAQKIASYAWKGGAKHVVVATGTSYADALSASPYASRLGAPLVLVPQRSGKLLTPARTVVRSTKAGTLHVVGGSGVVPSKVVTALKKGTKVTKTPRYGGADRFATSAKLLAKFPKGTPAVYWANGFGFADAVAGSAVAGANGSALALSARHCVPASVSKQVKRIAPRSKVALGGTYVITKDALAGTTCRKNDPRVIDPAAHSNPHSPLTIVNKKRPLRPKGFVPSSLTYPKGVPNANGQPLKPDAARALERLRTGGKRAGYSYTLSSGYRSYNTQSAVYNGWVRQDGRKVADTYSARPGFSEHQTGFAADVYAAGYCQGTCFGGTSAGRWLNNHAHKYGFIIRYQKGMQNVVGYQYEPWHLRYVGVPVATDMKKQGYRSMEQYFGFPAAPNY
ncbi:cell wall-binding repeat-containing protein [Leucobacter sp. GX24907]